MTITHEKALPPGGAKEKESREKMENVRKKISGCITGFRAVMMILGIMIIVSGKETVWAAVLPVEINEANFPDPNFRAVISGREIDTDGNGLLDEQEIARTINIYCEGMNVRSLQGIEFFGNLQGLWCKDNGIESMDLSNNRELCGVWCSGNPLSSLDFSANPKLEWVYCYDCCLTSLNVTGNPKMAFIECNTNPLKELDVTHNPLLEHLTCGSCELTVLNLQNNPRLAHLDAFSNHLTALDVSGNPLMKRLDIWNNPGLGSIDISRNPDLQYYNCAYNDAGSVDVSRNPELQKLICSYNHISELDLSHNPKLAYLDCAVNRISTLDLSENPRITFLQAFTNSFSSLNIGNNRFLIKTYNEGVKKEEYSVCRGHSWTIDYGGDTSTGGDTIYFLCIDDAVTLLAEPAGGETAGRDAGGEAEPADTEDLITRELAAQTLYEMAGKPDVSGQKSRFKDVIPGTWYENAVIWGEKNAICIGFPDISSDTFGVGKWITRQDLVLMLMRYAEVMNYKRAIDFGRSDEYLDYYEIDYYAWEAVTWAATWEIMNGIGEPGAPKSEQKIEPHKKATRTEFEEMLKRLAEVNNVKGNSFVISQADKTEPIPEVDLQSGNAEADWEADFDENSLLREEGAEAVKPEDAPEAVLMPDESEPAQESAQKEADGFWYIVLMAAVTLGIACYVLWKSRISHRG